jgi:SOS response regulatory protein OraA/RecX
VDDEFLGCLPQKLIPAEYFLQQRSSGDAPVIARSLLASLTKQSTLHTSEEDGGEELHTPHSTLHTLRDYVYKNAQAHLLDYLAKMEHCTFDCRNFLKKLEVPDKVINAVLKEAEDKKWLSDSRYAELYTEDAILCGRSPLDIKHKLRQKRIDPAIIDKTIEKLFNQETQNDLLNDLIEKMLSKYSELPPQKQFEKIATALYRKGFQYQDYEAILQRRLVIVKNNL